MIEKRRRRTRDGKPYAVYRVRFRDSTGVERSKTLPRGTTKEQAQDYERRRELREMEQGPAKRRPLTKEVRFMVNRRDGYQCVECGEHEIHELSIDHRVPVVLGGTNEPDNLRTLCRRCNSAKGGRL